MHSFYVSLCVNLIDSETLLLKKIHGCRLRFLFRKVDWNDNSGGNFKDSKILWPQVDFLLLHTAS